MVLLGVQQTAGHMKNEGPKQCVWSVGTISELNIRYLGEWDVQEVTSEGVKCGGP